MGISASVSLLDDPLIIDVTFSNLYTSSAINNFSSSNEVGIGISAGFLMNEHFTVRGSLNQSWLVDKIAIPSTIMGASLNYKIDEKNNLRLALSANHFGNNTVLQTGFSYIYRK